MEIAFVLGLLGVAMVLFATEKLPVDVVTLLMIVALTLTGVISVDEAFAGFSDDIIIILASIFVISGALREAGVLDQVAQLLLRHAGASPRLLLPLVMGVSGFFSAFMNNTTVTAMFTGPVMGVARKLKVSPSKLLMPLAHASIFGGTCTLIGTSTNVAVSGYMSRHGIAEVGLFEITAVGVILLSVGIAYMLLVGHRLLPKRTDDSLTEEYGMRKYLSEIVVRSGSPLVGQMSYQSDLSILGFQILKIIRKGSEFVPTSRDPILEGDIVLVAGHVENLMKVRSIEGIDIVPAIEFGDPDLQQGDISIAEVLVVPGSELEGSTLKDASFRQRYGLAALAIYRGGHALREQLGDIPLRGGDLLLVQAAKDQLQMLGRSSDLAIMSQVEDARDRTRSGWVVLGGFGLAILLASLHVLPLSIAMLCVALLAVLSRCLTPEQAYQSIEWRLLILIAGMTAFGQAMENSGAASFVAGLLTDSLKPFGVTALLGGFVVLTILLTQPMSNAAAALVILPIALDTADRMGLSGRSFGIAVMLAASISVLTPFEPSCLIVYGPGKYRFRDFMYVGGPITLILGALIVWLVPIFWPLF